MQVLQSVFIESILVFLNRNSAMLTQREIYNKSDSDENVRRLSWSEILAYIEL